MNLEPIPRGRKIALAILILAGITIAISIQYFSSKRILQTNNLQQMFSSQHPFEDRARQITNEIANEIKLQREQADYAAWTNKMNQQQIEFSNREAAEMEWFKTNILKK